MAPEAAKSMDEIAALITNGQAAGVDDATNDDEIDPTIGSDEGEEGEETLEELEADADEVDEEGDESEDETNIDEDGSNPEPQILELDDDDLVEVMVDGKLEQLTLGQLKRAASGEGAIEKRLTEATEERKAAQAERAKWEKERNKQTHSLVTAFDALHNIVFQPRVSPPDETLRQRDANKYLIQKADYDAEMQRLATLKGQVQQFYGQIQNDISESEKEFRKAQAATLAKKLPVLRDKQRGPEAQKRIVDAAMQYGFTAEEIKTAADHRMFLMAYDAAQWRASQKAGSEKTLEKANAVKKKPARTIRSGAVAKKRSISQNNAKQKAAVKKKAQKTGKIDDIAAFIVR